MEKNAIYVNAKIFTSNEEMPYAEAMAVKDGEICWVGMEKDIPQDIDLPKVDLQGKRVLPGFIDSHMHAAMLASFSKQISSLPPVVNSIEELKEKIKEARKDLKEGQWILGWGYDEGKFAEKRSINRYDLDEGAPDVPVSITRVCGHIRCVNSKALELAGIDENTPDPQGGTIDRDENGKPTGVLRENARNLMMDVMPVETEEEEAQNIADLGELLASQGITAVTDMGDLYDRDYYDIYKSAVDKGFKQKLAMYYLWDYFYDKEDFHISEEKLNNKNQIFVKGVKLISDGSFGGKTAWMYKPYLGTEDEYGISVSSDELMDSAIEAAKKYKCQLALHAMGARAIDRVVNRAYREENWMPESESPYVRIEHATDPTDEAIEKVIEKGMAFVTQPIFLYAEIESYLKNLGVEWMKKCYPIKTLLDRGVRMVLSSDAPATAWALPSDPFPGLKGAVNRVAYDGTDCDKAEAIDIETAIVLYTREAAKVAGFDRIGELKAGYKADFIVLDKDILNIDSMKIDEVKVERTYIDGNRVY